MEVHPAINCKDKECFLGRLEMAKTFLDKNEWLHIDVSDGTYSKNKIFLDNDILSGFSGKFNIEAHLMIAENEIYDAHWFSGLYKRLFVQADVVGDWEKIIEMGKLNNIEIGAVVNVGKSEVKIPEAISTIEILAVNPGESGQHFDERAIYTIRAFKKEYNHATIVVDGGVDFNIGQRLKEVGADALVSSSYIWDSQNPVLAYEKLSSI